MKNRLILYFFVLAGFAFSQNTIFLSPQSYNLEKYISIEAHFSPPSGFKRVKTDSNSFAAYLRKLPVVASTNNVLDFKNNIRVKAGDSTLAAVVPFAIKGKRLWQCMDILLILRVDYLKKEKDTESIKFPLPDGLILSWKEWRDGFRPDFSGLRFYKTRSETFNATANSFKRYLNSIFSYSNTQTFFYHYPQVSLGSIKPGDFIVKKGKKGHAVLVLDIAVNDRNEKVALIGQGDTPACQFYILKSKQNSPWFRISEQADSPELPISKKMYWSGLRRFAE